MKISTPKMMGNAHKNLILSMLLKHGPLSRADIARKLHISPPATSSNICSLLEAGVITEVGSGVTEMGRKPILLDINKNYMHIVGVDIRENCVYIGLAGFSGELISIREFPSLAAEGAGRVIEQIIAGVEALLQENMNMEIGAIAVAAPGIVDEATGNVSLSTVIPHWDGHNLRDELSSHFRVAVFIQNDVEMALLGEHTSGIGRDIDNLVYIKLGDGVASRILLDGQLLKGKNLAAGEIGYMLLDRSLIQDTFTPRGSLERTICNRAVQEQFKRFTDLAGCRAISQEAITISKLIALSNEGEPIANEILSDLLDYLAMAVVNLTAVLDIDLVILSEDLENLSNEKLDYMREFISKHVPFVPRILHSQLGHRAEITGCIQYALKYLLKSVSSAL